MSLLLWQFRAVKGLAQNIYTSSVLYIINKHIIYNLKLMVSTRPNINTESPAGARRENKIYVMIFFGKAVSGIPALKPAALENMTK